MKTNRTIATMLAVVSVAACAAPTAPGDGAELGQAAAAVTTDPILEPDPPPIPVPFANLCSSYSTYDMNADGVDEIDSLQLMSFEPATAPIKPNGMVMVLVEPRLLADFPGSRRTELAAMLANWRQDLLNEGFTTRFVAASVYAGAAHQDGLTVLAMRRFIKSVRTNYPSLKGVVLVGAFPEASLVHSTTLHRIDDDVTINDVKYTHVDSYSLHPNRINAGSDLVLGDLDGNWESLYRKDLVHMPYWTMIPAATTVWPSVEVTASTFEYHDADWADVFDIRDEQTTIVNYSRTQLKVRFNSWYPKNAELTTSDKASPNPIARPEIVISRINAKHLAFEPTAPVDLNGNSPVMNGQAQDLVYDGYAPDLQWVFDPKLEQRILIDYFTRNSAFRHGADRALPFFTSVVRAQNAGMPLLASPASINAFLQDAATFSSWYDKDEADLAEFYNFLKHPAVLRGIEAHSNTTSSVFDAPADPSRLIAALGGKPWRWVPDFSGPQVLLKPTTAGKLSRYELHRAQWESKVLQNSGQAFYIHGGCDLTLPDHSDVLPYNDPAYGKFQNGESILFFANGLALYGRGKVFYDKPDGFPEAIKAGVPSYFGRGWRGQFNHDAAEGSLASQPYRTKKAYYWTMLGDWTLRLRY
jgi:hypothetical protein